MNLFDFKPEQTQVNQNTDFNEKDLSNFRDLLSKWIEPERAKSVILKAKTPQWPSRGEMWIQMWKDIFSGATKSIESWFWDIAWAFKPETFVQREWWPQTVKTDKRETINRLEQFWRWIRDVAAWWIESVLWTAAWTVLWVFTPEIQAWIEKVMETEAWKKTLESYESLPVDVKESFIDTLETIWLRWGQKAVAETMQANVEWIKAWAKRLPKIAEDISEWLRNVKVNKATKNIEKWEDILFEAVNPTTKENKAVLKKRVQDLVPYIEKNPLKNDLEDVKARIDKGMRDAWDNMSKYENEVWVKGRVEIQPIIDKIENTFKKKIDWVIVDDATAKIADDLIAKLKEFKSWNITDANIISLRRAWDWIIQKNKWFMLSADSNIKWDIFNEANKFLRQEIKKSNPEYAKYLEEYHKTKTLWDVIEATINRRIWQQKGWFIKRWFDIWARVTWAWLWWAVWLVATEAAIQWANILSWPSFKLARWAKLLKKWKETLSKTKKTKDGMDTTSPNNLDSRLDRKQPVKKEVKKSKPLKKTTKSKTEFIKDKISEFKSVSKADKVKLLNKYEEALKTKAKIIFWQPRQVVEELVEELKELTK